IISDYASGATTIYGGSGNDTINLYAPNAVIDGGAGDDSYNENGYSCEYLFSGSDNLGSDYINGGYGDVFDFTQRSSPIDLTIDYNSISGSDVTVTASSAIGGTLFGTANSDHFSGIGNGRFSYIDGYGGGDTYSYANSSSLSVSVIDYSG